MQAAMGNWSQERAAIESGAGTRCTGVPITLECNHCKILEFRSYVQQVWGASVVSVVDALQVIGCPLRYGNTGATEPPFSAGKTT